MRITSSFGIAPRQTPENQRLGGELPYSGGADPLFCPTVDSGFSRFLPNNYPALPPTAPARPVRALGALIEVRKARVA